jgi:hypothetical protein
MTDTHDAGTDLSVPASSSVDLVPPEARTELDRIRRRWGELSLARVAEAAPAVRSEVTDLAALTAPGVDVPDLGDEVLADQLAVVVWDACAAGRSAGIGQRLTALRRSLP